MKKTKYMKKGGTLKRKGGGMTGMKKTKYMAKGGPMKKTKYMSKGCLLYTSPSPRDGLLSRMPSSA